MKDRKLKVLFVDDEENNLISFKANFRKEYEIYTAVTAIEAFDILETVNINIIISDQRMPHTTGVEFFESSINKHPDCIRLLITGYADIDVVVDAINKGQISKYIQKPWDYEKLALAIDHCATLYKSRQELKIKNDELSKMNEELNKFIYSVSHDLRSPLTSIQGLINLAKLNPESKTSLEYFNLIEGRVERLDTSIRSIIEYYKNYKLNSDTERINIKELINSTIEILKYTAEKVDINIEILGEGVFSGDKLRLKIVLENLISNAIKYRVSHEEVHKINIKAFVDKEKLSISIEDTGIGMDNEYLEKIFELFFRIENPVSRDGSGLGLYIVKEAVNRMKGRITVNSVKNKGTIFTVFIPNGTDLI